MDLDGFQKDLGIITVDPLHSPAEFLITAWNRKVSEALDRIAPM